MNLKKVTSKHKSKTYEYAQIVRSVRREEDGKPTQEVVRSLGGMRTGEDWEWARSVLESMKKEEELVKLGDLKIDRQLELGGIWAGEDVWRNHGIQKPLMESFAGRKTEYNLERITFLLAVNRFYEPSSDLAAHQWINEKAFSYITDVNRNWVYRTLEPKFDTFSFISELKT